MRHLLNPSLYSISLSTVKVYSRIVWWSGDLSLLFSLRTFITHSHTHTQNTHHREKKATLLLFLSYFVLSYETLIFSLSLSLSLQSFAFCISCHFSVFAFFLSMQNFSPFVFISLNSFVFWLSFFLSLNSPPLFIS